MKRPGSRIGGYAEEVAAAVRRRRDVRRPRVRVRVGGGEARLLANDSAPGSDLLELARDMIGGPPQDQLQGGGPHDG